MGSLSKINNGNVMTTPKAKEAIFCGAKETILAKWKIYDMTHL
jgi:hypothetical protein